MSQPAKRKVSTKSLHEKYKALKEIENGSHIHVVKKQGEDYQCCYKGKRPQDEDLKGGSYDKLDQAVYKYFLNVRSQDIPVSGPVLTVHLTPKYFFSLK